MKNIFLTTTFMLLLVYAAFPSGKEQVATARFISNTHGISGGNVYFQVEVKFNKTLKMTAPPEIVLPQGWTFQFDYVPNTGTTLWENSTMVFSGQVVCPNTGNNLPFYPKGLEFTMPVAEMDSTGDSLTVSAEAMTYFAPWNEVEIWSETDFHSLKRVWIHDQSVTDTTRISVAKEDVPVSDIPDEFDYEEEWQEDFYLKKVPGLAYMVPMMATHPDTVAMYHNEDYPYGVVPDSLTTPTDTATGIFQPLGWFDSRTFTGQISGRLVTTITNDVGEQVEIPLSGVHISLREKDWGFNQNFGELHTDENGNFHFSVNRTQSFTEGSTIELFLRLNTTNKEYDIDVELRRNLPNLFTQAIELGSAGTSFNADVGDIDVSFGAYKTVSYAWKAWRFAENNGITLPEGLFILAYQPLISGSFFLPDGLGNSWSIIRPTIRLVPGAEEDENTVYHEFGHFLMWGAQGQNFITPATDEPGDLGHNPELENTSRLAWYEGWATAFQAICDAAYQHEDGEYGDEPEGTDYEYEDLDEKDFINNGIWSEYYIACAIYDLWDGADKGLPGPGPGSPGYQDEYGWNLNHDANDNISLSFSQLIAPILPGSGSLITHIGQYYQRLVSSISDCHLRSDISRCFQENRVLYDIDGLPFQDSRLSSDEIAFGLQETITGWLTEVEITYEDTYKLNFFGERTVNVPVTSTTYPYITDPVTISGDKITEAGTLILNGRNTGNNLGIGVMSTCSGTDIEVSDGTLEFGGEGQSMRLNLNGPSQLVTWQYGSLGMKEQSEIRVNDEAKLEFFSSTTTNLSGSSAIIVKSGGTLYIHDGATVNLSEDSRIIVEDGGYVCIEPNATVNLNGNAVVTRTPNSTLGLHPLWEDLSHECSDFNYCPSSSEPANALYFDGQDDFAQVVHDPVMNFGAGDFTLEAIVSPDQSASGIVSLLSKRTYVNGSQADGFIFGIWNGRLYAQLAGAPNIIDNSTAYDLLDGNCHHVALTRDNGLCQFYVDGQPTMSFTSNRNISSPGNLRIGRNGLSGLFFTGAISEVKLWNNARTAAEIENGINSGSITASTVGAWEFTGGMQELQDLSSNNLAGFLGTISSCSVEDESDPQWIPNGNQNCIFGSPMREALVANDEGKSGPLLLPNPVQNRVKVQYSGGTVTQLLFTDMHGKEIKTVTGYSSGTFIDVSDLAKGSYVIKVLKGAGMKVVRFVKL